MRWSLKSILILLILLLGVILITIGFTKARTTSFILEKQQKAGLAFLARASQDKSLAPGLVNSPRLMRAMILTIEEDEWEHPEFFIVAAGIMTAAVAVVLANRERSPSS